ncbi:MAG: DUF4955 domain-containing protein [Bacteroidales bacterium]|nr:DUF4955 domain-containing protein [Bacteroidales bacterium]
MNGFTKILAAAAFCAVLVPGCTGIGELQMEVNAIASRVEALEDAVGAVNSNTIALKALFGPKILVTGIVSNDTGYEVSLSDGTVVNIIDGAGIVPAVPVVSVDDEGYWIISTDGGVTFIRIEDADMALLPSGHTPLLKVDTDGYWLISTDGGESWDFVYDENGKKQSADDPVAVKGDNSVFANVRYDADDSRVTFVLKNGLSLTLDVVGDFYVDIAGWHDGVRIYRNESVQYPVQYVDVSSVVVYDAPAGWEVVFDDEKMSISPSADTPSGEYSITLFVVSGDGYAKTFDIMAEYVDEEYSGSGCKEWEDFYRKSRENILLDYSYAGYDHGMSAPPEAASLGWTVYNVCDYGAVPDDGKSDRDAFLKAYSAAIGPGGVRRSSAKAVIWFPEGEFILHDSSDDLADGISQSLVIEAGDIIVKGAGAGRTTISMKDPNQPSDPSQMWSCPTMITVRRSSSSSKVADIVSDAEKGSFSVTLSSTAGISAGDYIMLSLTNNDPELVANELQPYPVEDQFTELIETGVVVVDYHQIRSIEGNTVTFEEPLMHEVESRWGWELYRYSYYSNVGIEDITFKGDAKDNFVHHGSWEDDSAYRMVEFLRINNAWCRRCSFTSCSELVSFTNCANCSAYDISVGGMRGHTSIHAQNSSRVFIGKVMDASSSGKGQYHGAGVAGRSMGTVLWHNHYGKDSCFESHASQPRATLVDACDGGWIDSRQGGDSNLQPNHLDDLVIWNFNATSVSSMASSWTWWRTDNKYWRFLPPAVVGYHGLYCNFVQSSCKVDSSHGTAVEPESLYEAQLKARLGYVPAWLNALK